MLKTIFKNTTQKVLSQYNPQIAQINLIGEKFKTFTDVELREKVTDLKKRSTIKGFNESIINEAFALVREASDRVLGLRHFDVQLIGGLVLNEGKIAEMITGEGKTLVALLPTFLNALSGKGVQVVTVNDYLARRDSEFAGQVQQFLGLTVGVIQENMDPKKRKENYNCDIVYVTNKELGFDYLRDNMTFTVEEIVQRPFSYCVIDEVDSILIDESSTPLIISGPSEAPTEKYPQTAKIGTMLKRDVHYLVDEKMQAVTLRNEGISFCEQVLGSTDLSSPDEPWVFYLLNSIKAKELFQLNKNYIINENQEIVIVDEFTGRTMLGRRWGDGLHQAIEAKENVPIQEESQTLSSITYQNLFLLYDKLSGMTGTAKTEEVEFEKIYNLPVVQVPTNKPIKRKDFSDLIYKDRYIKWKAVAQECLEMYNIGRPVLVGTTTIENSELLAALLHEYNVSYGLLNARPENIEREAEIVAQAGCKNAVTIATNMAGRGTDIVLGGNPKFMTSSTLKTFFEESDTTSISNTLNMGSSAKDKNLNESINLDLYNKVFVENKLKVQKDGEEIRKLGGLHVIGTERHDSRRIDNQLRGRSGRQGDPGSSRFFLSLEDKLLRVFGGDQVLNVLQDIGFKDDTPIQSSLLNSSLESAQKKVEASSFDTRKELFEYDQALNIHRNSIYTERKCMLKERNLRHWVVDYAEYTLSELFFYCKNRKDVENAKQFLIGLQNLVGVPFSVNFKQGKWEFDNCLKFLQQQIQVAYDLKELELENIERGLLRELERVFILQQIDYSWKTHLQKMGFLKDSIKWRAYAQKNPLTEYKKEAFNYFLMMIARIRHRVIYFLLRAKVVFY